MEPTEDLKKLEDCCDAFYRGDPESQRLAHNVLLPLVNDPSSLPRLQWILANSHNANALIFAASGLLKIVTTGWNRIPEAAKGETRTFTLNYLFSRGPPLLRSAPALLQNLIRLLCRIVKLSWLESVENQNITDQVKQFLQASTDHWVVGLMIFTTLTEDFQPVAGPSLPRSRRAAISFRETALSEIFEIAVTILQQVHTGVLHLNQGSDEVLLLKRILELVVNCLSFDFMGAVGDESTDDQATVMVPRGWTSLKTQRIPELLFEVYTKSWTSLGRPCPDCARLCLQCLVLVAAIRKSFFEKEEDRAAHIAQLVEGTSKLIRSNLGLQDDQCYHELCRLLGKINAANHLFEMSQADNFEPWLDGVFRFTIQSLEDWKRLPNSKHYLVGLWSNMVSPLLYLKDRGPANLFELIRNVAISFIDSRMKVAEVVAQSLIDGADYDFEDPLASEVMRTEQLEVVSGLSRAAYVEIAQHLMDLFQQTQTALREGRLRPEIFHQKASWLIYMMGSLVTVSAGPRNQRIVLLSGAGLLEAKFDDDVVEDHESYKTVGQMSSVVFSLSAETDKLESTPAILELAYLYFVEQFREVFIGERAKQSMQLQVTECLADVLPNAATGDVLNLIVDKLLRNLQRRVADEIVVKRTLQILHSSVTGVSVVHAPDRLPYFVVSGKLVLQSSLIQEVLKDHQNSRFVFMQVPKYGKFRTTYYNATMKLLFMDMKDDVQRFTNFMEPFTTKVEALRQSASSGFFESPTTKQEVVHLSRDLRGCLAAATTSDQYNLLFNWLVDHPKKPGQSRVDLFTKATTLWWNEHDVMIPILKLFVELVHNRSQRIYFDTNSPNGIFLFKVISSLLLAYGQRILDRTHFTDIYRQKYKGIACALEMFSHTLAGGFTNFGVFSVYDDRVLPNSLNMALQLCLSIPEEDLQAYIKALRPFYYYVELASQNFMDDVIRINPNLLAKLLRCLEDGLCSFDNSVSIQCCSTIDNIVNYVFENKDKQDDNGQTVRRFLTEQPFALRRILQLAFSLIISGESIPTWGLSRSMLGLILLHPEDYVKLQTQLMEQQPFEKRDKIKGYFDDLMAGVEPTLKGNNKDVFTNHLYVFAQDMRASIG